MPTFAHYGIPVEQQRSISNSYGGREYGDKLDAARCLMCQRPFTLLFDEHDENKRYGCGTIKSGGRCDDCGWWLFDYNQYDFDGGVHSQFVGELAWYEVEGLTTPIAMLASHIARNNELIYDVHPRKFEELVGGLLREHLNCSVELTKQTRDGGKDLICCDSETGKFYVEIKRYAKSRKVGLGVVQRFVGALYGDQVSSGLIVTSSTYTAKATHECIKVNEVKGPVNLELCDIEDVLAWLNVVREKNDDDVLSVIRNLTPYSPNVRKAELNM